MGRMDFSEALLCLKEGKKIARLGWNGKGLSVYMIDGMDLDIHGTELNTFLVIRNEATRLVNTWVPSISDLFANDWEVVL